MSASALWLGAALAAQANDLVDLGYANGLVLRGTGATQSVYFPLPVNSQGATLALSFTASAALNQTSSITVMAGNVPLATVPDTAASPIQIQVPPRFTQGAFLQLSFVTDHARCYDTTADWVVVQPETSLTPKAPNPLGVGDLWRNATTPLTIAVPATPTLADIQTALILSTALVERGIAPYFTSDTAQANILIDPSAKALATAQPDGQPSRIVVPDAAAARALVAAAPALRDQAQSHAHATLEPAATRAARGVSFGALGLGPMNIAVRHDARMDLDLPFSALPANRHATAITLYGHGMSLPPGQSEIISLELGGNVVWSRAFTGTVALNGVKVPLPQPLLDSGAKVQLHAIRLGQVDACETFTPLTFTLDDSTRLTLSDGPPSPIRFAGFNTAGRGPVPVLTDLPPASLPPALPLLAELLGAAGANPLAVTVSGTQTPPTRPFILVSHQATPVVSIAPIPQTKGPLVLPLPNQQTSVTLPDHGDDSLLQLVSAGKGPAYVPGLWLNPGSPASLAQAALPGDGNVALYDGANSPATFLTTLHDTVLPAQQTDIWAILLDNWNIELLGALWLILLVLLVVLVVRRRRRGK
ncbi:cellulose biosynthesis cyclic di-GMP-binding regulatory protein BcsB [Acidocella sp.]|uniref:cellulose biosynthesis cyclic di-GMP-binding regulatory protein BcsB n=1 Tax=Acidocella sp. TaxID=50710 RepID=UPI003D04385F